MKPSGVQLARPILPPGLQTRDELRGGTLLIGREHHAEGRDDDVEARIRERQLLRIGLAEIDDEPLGIGALAGALEQRRHVVGRDHLAPAPRRGERHVAVAGRDVEHRLPGAKIERLAQLLADDLQGGADDGIVAGGPGALLARLDGAQIDLGGVDCRGSDRHHRGGRLAWA